MTIGNEREQLLFAEWESAGEDEVRLRLNSNKYSPVDRQLMQSWLDIKASNRNLVFQKRTDLNQKWILRLNIAILILTIIMVIISFFSFIFIDGQPKKYTDTPTKNEEAKQPLILKSSDKTTK